MLVRDYKSIIKGMNIKRSLGQNFLVNEEIAKLEAQYATERNVVELGPGLGILTKELCSVASRVVAVEYDSSMYNFLKSTMKHRNLDLINMDFFKLKREKLGKIDIMISNIPYKLSSRVIMWLSANKIPAVLCLQKEFVEHMLAKSNTKKYSKLSIICALQFSVYHLMNVGSSNFYPEPRVNSAIIYMKPKEKAIDSETLSTINLLMMHKKKKLRNAILDSLSSLAIDKSSAKNLIGRIEERDKRLFQLKPENIRLIAERINKLLKQNQKE